MEGKDMDTRQVVTKYFEYVNTARWDDWLALFDENIVMDEQLGGHIEGIAALSKSIEGLRTSPKFKNHPVKMVVEGNRAMVVWHIETAGPKGERIEADGANYYEVKNGKIKYFANYHDSKPFKPILEP
jgi:ketosteroid isomerase-like protein